MYKVYFTCWFFKKKIQCADIKNLNMFSQFYFGDSDFASGFNFFLLKAIFTTKSFFCYEMGVGLGRSHKNLNLYKLTLQKGEPVNTRFHIGKGKP
jgi:hypothetical protein